ncbi:uncharacterized protein [Panulirus ornatus]|uniref:uncharacterized protein n=1 Tax=Panulirus ornatus TaxID=150431 RepID=UPI003A84C16E
MVFVAASRWCWVGLAALLLLHVIPSYTHQVQDQQSLSQNHDAPQQRYLRPKATKTLHSTSLGSSWLEDLGGHYQTHFPPATTPRRTPSHPTESNLGYSRQETTTYNSEHYRWVDPVNDFGQDHREHSRYDSTVYQKAARQDARHQYDVHNHHQEQNNLYTTNLQPPQPYPQQEPYSSQHGQLFTGHQQMFLPHQNLALQGEAHLVGNHTLQPQQTLAHTILHSGHHSDMSSTAAPHHHENSIPQNHSAVLNNQQDSVLDRKEGASVSATRSQQELGNSDSSRQREVYTGQRPSRSSGGDKKRPNILLIMTDDQDVDLGKFLCSIQILVSTVGDPYNFVPRRCPIQILVSTQVTIRDSCFHIDAPCRHLVSTQVTHRDSCFHNRCPMQNLVSTVGAPYRFLYPQKITHTDSCFHLGAPYRFLYPQEVTHTDFCIHIGYPYRLSFLNGSPTVETRIYGAPIVEKRICMGHLLWKQESARGTYCGYKNLYGSPTVETRICMGHLLWIQESVWGTYCGNKNLYGSPTVETRICMGHLLWKQESEEESIWGTYCGNILYGPLAVETKICMGQLMWKQEFVWGTYSGNKNLYGAPTVETRIYMGHLVYTNNHNCSSRQWQETHERRSFATYLRAAGYRTGYFGKYLNKYNGSHVPAGWQEWGGLLKNSRYYNYTVQRNGQFIKYGDQYPKDYYPHVITSEGINFLKKHKGMNPSSPMLLVLSYPAPHGPEDSAPEHAHRFFNATDHNTMAYNYAPNPDKQWLLQFIGRMHDIELKFTDLLMTKRLQTLQTVDEALAKLINTLEAVGELNNTYIFYTSDHGYHLGQFGLVKGKSMPFEFDIKVPFLARGPGIRSGSQISKIALNVDLAPTFLDIAGLEAPPHMDGRSLLPVLKSTSFGQSDTFAWRDSFLVESSGRHREEDALELREQRRLQRAQGLTGAETEGGLYTSKRERLEIICQGDEYRSPCKPHQKWECIRGEYRWRLQKCRKKRVRRPRIKWRQRNCVCEPDLGMGYLVKLDSAERRKQRIFLKKHVTQDLKKYDAKFIKVFSDVDSSEIVERYLGALVLQNSSGLHSHEIRYRRSIKEEMSVMEMNNEDSVYEDSGADDVDAFVKEEEIREIDVTIDSLTDELESLESVSSTAATSIVNGNVSLLATSLTGKTPVDTRHGCRVTGTSVDCTDDVYHDPHAWKLSKFVIDQQIRRLRHQLIVMKDIRKHLRDSRPESVVNSEDYDSYEDETGASRDLNILIGENHFLGQNDAGDTSRIEASDVFEGEPGYERIYDAVDVDVDYENDVFNSSEDISENEHFKGQDGPSNPDYDEEGYHDGEDSSNVEDGQVIIIGTDYHMVGETHHQRNNLKNPEDLGRKEEDHTTMENPRADVTQMQRVPGRYRSQAGKQFHLFPVREPSQQQPLTTVDNETSERSRCWCDKNFRLEIKQAERQRKREERLKLRLERQRVKQERRQIKEKKKLRKLKNNLAQCNYTMLNCYTHDNDHWRTPPLWHDGKFCFCMNAINNTYWCVRTINQTHNFLYCEFITGLVTYYDLNIDPHQLRNVAFTLSNKRLAELHHRLESLRTCSGASHCDDLPTFEISKSNDRENLHNREEDKISNSVEVPVLTRLDKHLTHRREKRRRLREERARQRKERRRVRKQQKNRRRNQFYEDRGKHILHTTGSDRHVVRLPRKSRIQERRREQKGHRREIRKEHKRRKKSQRERISLNG